MKMTTRIRVSAFFMVLVFGGAVCFRTAVWGQAQDNTRKVPKKDDKKETKKETKKEDSKKEDTKKEPDRPPEKKCHTVTKRYKCGSHKECFDGDNKNCVDVPDFCTTTEEVCR